MLAATSARAEALRIRGARVLERRVDAMVASEVLVAATAGPIEELRGHVADVFELLGPRAGVNKARRRSLARIRREWDDAIVAAVPSGGRVRLSLE